jgi:nitroreductase
MDLDKVVRRRRMRRGFSPEALSPELVDDLLKVALTAPSAGFTQGVEWFVLEEAEDRGRFFEVTSDEGFVSRPGPTAGILAAPVIVVPVVDPKAYERRYAEGDKAPSGLAGVPREQWPVPYWTVDAAFGVMLLLLAAEDAGLAALFFRLHRPAHVLEGAFSIPPGADVIGAVALGWPDRDDPGPVGSSARRPRRPFDELVHRGAW